MHKELHVLFMIASLVGPWQALIQSPPYSTYHGKNHTMTAEDTYAWEWCKPFGGGLMGAHLHGLPCHDLDGDVVSQRGDLLEEDDCPVPRLSCSVNSVP